MMSARLLDDLFIGSTLQPPGTFGNLAAGTSQILLSPRMVQWGTQSAWVFTGYSLRFDVSDVSDVSQCSVVVSTLGNPVTSHVASKCLH